MDAYMYNVMPIVFFFLQMGYYYHIKLRVQGEALWAGVSDQVAGVVVVTGVPRAGLGPPDLTLTPVPHHTYTCGHANICTLNTFSRTRTHPYSYVHIHTYIQIHSFIVDIQEFVLTGLLAMLSVHRTFDVCLSFVSQHRSY